MGFIRLILALSVLRSHTHSTLLGADLVPGDIAVESFYAISGFYMAMILNEKYVLKRDYFIFLQQRFFRIYPTYFTVLFLCLTAAVISFFLHPADGGRAASFFSHELSPLTILFLVATNLFIIGQDLALFLAIGPHGDLYFTTNFSAENIPAWIYLLVPPAWSLALEITFYLIAPLIVRKSLFFQISLILLSLSLRFIFRYWFNLFNDPWSFRFFFFELSFFLIGSIAYRAWGLRKALYNEVLPYIGWLRWPFLLALLNYDDVFGTNDAGCVILFSFWFLLIPFFFLATKTSAFDKLLGELSYPLYLSHWLTIQIMGHWAKYLPHWYQGCFYSLGAIIVAYPICRWIDYPVERFRHGLLPKRDQFPRS